MGDERLFPRVASALLNAWSNTIAVLVLGIYREDHIYHYNNYSPTTCQHLPKADHTKSSDHFLAKDRPHQVIRPFSCQRQTTPSHQTIFLPKTDHTKSSDHFLAKGRPHQVIRPFSCQRQTTPSHQTIFLPKADHTKSSDHFLAKTDHTKSSDHFLAKDRPHQVIRPFPCQRQTI